MDPGKEMSGSFVVFWVYEPRILVHNSYLLIKTTLCLFCIFISRLYVSKESKCFICCKNLKLTFRGLKRPDITYKTHVV